MKTFPLADLRDQIAKQLETRAPWVALTYAFNDGSSETAQPERWIPESAYQHATLFLYRAIQDRRIALLNAFGLPARADNEGQAVKELATDEAGARLLFELAGMEARTEEHAPATASATAEATTTPKAATRGASKKEMLTNDWPLKPDQQINFDDVLSDVPKWLSSARIIRGSPGKGSSMWNPAMFAVCLVCRNKSTKSAMTSHIKNYFPEWANEWETRSESL